MKATFLCCILLLAGSASCSPVEDNSIILNINIPDWILDLISGVELPEAIQNIIDRLPEIIAAIPDIIDRLPEIIAQIVDRIPEVIPIILDKLPEIIAQVPALLERIREILEVIINRIPELIPVILEKIPAILEAIPGIYDRIRQILEGLDLPDWFPTLPELEIPDGWPEIPALPEFNEPTPGNPTSISDYPGIVQIEIGTGPVWVQGCVGSILTSYHVLSAARCFSGSLYDDRFRRIRAGSSNRFEGNDIVGVERVTNHPDFNADSFNADISVVRLLTNLILSANIQQTAIVPQGFSLPAGIGVTVVGWGSTAQGGLISDRGLYEIDLNVIDETSCAHRWRLVPSFSVENTMCVADPKYGGRNGDVRDLGAPIYYQNIVTGIISIGAPVGNQYLPVVTTPIGLYTNWVVANAN